MSCRTGSPCPERCGVHQRAISPYSEFVISSCCRRIKGRSTNGLSGCWKVPIAQEGRGCARIWALIRLKLPASSIPALSQIWRSSGPARNVFWNRFCCSAVEAASFIKMQPSHNKCKLYHCNRCFRLRLYPARLLTDDIYNL